MTELIGLLGVPGSVAALLACVALGLHLADRLGLRRGRSTATGEHSATWQANIVSAITNLTDATATLGEKTENNWKELSAMHSVLLEMQLRMKQLATREEVKDLFTQNRHDVRNILTPLSTDVQLLLREVNK